MSLTLSEAPKTGFVPLRPDGPYKVGVQWLSGRVLDLEIEGLWVGPHWRHWDVALSKTLNSLLSTGPEVIKLFSYQEIYPANKC